MAPVERPFPVSELETRVHYAPKEAKLKNRKLGKDFDLKDCDLYELVQYSCTPMDIHTENILKSPTGRSQMECFPFTRLFRRCQQGDKYFHVETTAWEGPGAWKQKQKQKRKATDTTQDQVQANAFAQYSGYFWSQK